MQGHPCSSCCTSVRSPGGLNKQMSVSENQGSTLSKTRDVLSTRNRKAEGQAGLETGWLQGPRDTRDQCFSLHFSSPLFSINCTCQKLHQGLTVPPRFTSSGTLIPFAGRFCLSPRITWSHALIHPTWSESRVELLGKCGSRCTSFGILGSKEYRLRRGSGWVRKGS